MNWWEFAGATSVEKHDAFTSWHDAVCLTEGIPHPGRDQADDTVELGECWTDAYVNVWDLADGRLVVQLGDDDPYTEGLTPTEVDPTSDLTDATVVRDSQSLPRVWGSDPVTRSVQNDA